MTANDELNARLASLTTAQLMEISLRLTLDDSVDAIIVCSRAERELEQRMPEAEFLAHLDAVDALLDASMAA